jgi:peptidoglycan hydrolase-like protein with peptidoglycan-binding domain
MPLTAPSAAPRTPSRRLTPSLRRTPSSRRTTRLLGATATASAAIVLAAVALASPASAAPVPPTPAGLPAAAESLASYVGASSCDATAKPGASGLGSLLTSTYPGTSYSSARPCGSDSLSTTEHYDGRAVDWMTNVRNTTQRGYANAALSWMLATDAKGNTFANARRLGVMYIIWNNHSWSAYRPQDGWREYNGCLSSTRAGTGYDTTCHRNHVHFSLSWEGAMKRSSYWSKVVAKPEYGPCRPWYLNWAPPSTAANFSRCTTPSKVVPLAGASSTGRQLVSYSGMYLREGKTGPAVTAVQAAIGTSATGSFSATTRKALATWQARNGVAATGVTDAATWRALTRLHAAPPVALGFDGDFRSDLLARHADGSLTLHGSASDSTGEVVGSGWQGFNAVFGAGDFNGDTHGDLLARKADGTLWLYTGNGQGGFQRGLRIGTGWQGFSRILSPGDVSGDGLPDVLAAKADGTLWLYRGNGRGSWAASGARVGTGWQIFDDVLSPGDFTGDGRGDVLARKADGTLWLYAGNGRSGFLRGLRVGNGWQIFDQLIPGGDRNGDGRSDVLARKPDGSLLLYAGNGRGGWSSGGKAVGSRWNRFDLVVGVR